jgi:translation initiation factor 1
MKEPGMADKPLYSTATGRQQKENSSKGASYQRGEGPAKMRLESKGRGGKSVTVIFNIPLDEEAARKLGSEMKSQFGCGGTFKDSSIELAGDMRDKVETFFTKKSLQIKRAGG